MRTSFRQGLVSAEVSGPNIPSYLLVNSNGVTIKGTNRPTVFTAAHGPKNYTVQFITDTLAVPASVNPNVDALYWLYLDINRATGARTFGATTLQPTYGTVAPSAPAAGQHWFDVSSSTMKVFQTTWQPVIRVFFGTRRGNNIQTMPFGSHVGLVSPSVSGSIIMDAMGVGIKDSTGYFITSEDVLLNEGVATHASVLEANVTTLPALQQIPAYAVVRKHNTQNGVVLATTGDVGEAVIGIAVISATIGEPVNMVVSGKVYNPLWNWERANMPLWISATGELVTIDPNRLSPSIQQRSPIARTIDAQTILFSQGLATVTANSKELAASLAQTSQLANQAYNKATEAMDIAENFDLSEIEQQLDALASAVATNAQAISTTQSNVSGLTTSQATLTAAVSQAEAAAAAASTTAGEAIASASAAQTAVAAMQTTVSGLQTEVADLSAEISDVLLRYPRTISTSAPTGIPREGEEWIVV